MKYVPTLFLLVTLGQVASAATITQTGSYSFIPTGSQTLAYNKFNPALGTLTSVTVTTSLTKSGGSLFLDNDSGTAASGNVSQTVRIDLASGDVSFVATVGTAGSNVNASTNFSVSLAADTGGDVSGYQNDGGADNGGQAFSDVSTSQTKTINPFFQNTYEGTGTFDITVDGIQSFNTSTVSGAAGSFTNSAATGEVTITYNYTAAIPEPTSALLGGIGLLALLRRRRN
jgi:hypothetical protein